MRQHLFAKEGLTYLSHKGYMDKITTRYPNFNDQRGHEKISGIRRRAGGMQSLISLVLFTTTGEGVTEPMLLCRDRESRNENGSYEEHVKPLNGVIHIGPPQMCTQNMSFRDSYDAFVHHLKNGFSSYITQVQYIDGDGKVLSKKNDVGKNCFLFEPVDGDYDTYLPHIELIRKETELMLAKIESVMEEGGTITRPVPPAPPIKSGRDEIKGDVFLLETSGFRLHKPQDPRLFNYGNNVRRVEIISADKQYIKPIVLLNPDSHIKQRAEFYRSQLDKNVVLLHPELQLETAEV